MSFSSLARTADSATVNGKADWSRRPIESVYIPVKEMLANAPGFRSLYAQREIHFEEIYPDILDRAYLPIPRGRRGNNVNNLLETLQNHMEGRVSVRDEAFFLRDRQGFLEFTLLAEGLRKLGLLSVLIRNGSLLEGSVLFWDEPETNLNPELYFPVIQTILKLQRMGVQIFLATHDYVILKEIDLQSTQNDEISFHSLCRGSDDGNITCRTVNNYLDVHRSAIDETFDRLYDEEVKRSMGG